MIAHILSNRQPVFLMALSTMMFVLSTVVPAPLVSQAQGNYGGATFTSLSFSSSIDGQSQSYFPLGIQQVFARLSYYNIPRGQGVTLMRQWYVNGVLSYQKQEAWNVAWGSTGYLNAISIYDFTQGLTPGNYHVVVSLMYDYPAAQVTGDFVIAGYPVPSVPANSTPAFSNLSMSTSPIGYDLETPFRWAVRAAVYLR